MTSILKQKLGTVAEKMLLTRWRQIMFWTAAMRSLFPSEDVQRNSGGNNDRLREAEDSNYGHLVSYIC